jgi:uncharacterized protein (DUF1330 family)
MHRLTKGFWMVAYVIFSRLQTKNDSEMAKYKSLAGATLTDHNVSRLARYGRHKILEGPSMEGILILQFPTFEEAENWYNSDSYQAASVHRHNGADYGVAIVEGT